MTSVIITLTLIFIWSPVCNGQCRGNKSADGVKSSIEDSLRYCIAECLDLTEDEAEEKCAFNTITGRIKGCDSVRPRKESKFKIICHFDYDMDISTLVIENGQPLCDILILSVAVFNKDTNLLEMKSEIWSKVISALKVAKKVGMKVTLRVGSWDESIMHPKEFTRLAKNEQLTAIFVKGVTEFVRKYDFDGITIAWLWPGCPQSACAQNVDRKTVTSFIRALATPLKVNGKIILYHMYGVFSSTIMAAGDYFSDIVDEIDYFYFEDHFQSGDWMPKTDFSFNLKETRDLMGELTTKIKRAKDFKRKVVISVEPAYPSYELRGQQVLKIGTVFVPYSKMNKRLNMPEWCELAKDPTYQLVKNAETQNYAIKSDNIFIFDDQESLTAKVNFVMEFGAGVGLHSLVTDDVNGACGCGKIPYLKLIFNTLKMDCEPIPCF
ncbi:chitinase-3-like protein 1 [Cloeon dipterum]|uniref:chitinase-3-like protein 1 n=1 Tax=Cloeon dipterum TaxID=197152 RepID=UPI0032206FF7